MSCPVCSPQRSRGCSGKEAARTPRGSPGAAEPEPGCCRASSSSGMSSRGRTLPGPAARLGEMVLAPRGRELRTRSVQQEACQRWCSSGKGRFKGEKASLPQQEPLRGLERHVSTNRCKEVAGCGRQLGTGELLWGTGEGQGGWGGNAVRIYGTNPCLTGYGPSSLEQLCRDRRQRASTTLSPEATWAQRCKEGRKVSLQPSSLLPWEHGG